MLSFFRFTSPAGQPGLRDSAVTALTALITGGLLYQLIGNVAVACGADQSTAAQVAALVSTMAASALHMLANGPSK